MDAGDCFRRRPINLKALKPASSARLQILLAASLWTVVGGCLAGFGSKWLIGARLPWLIPVAIVPGIAKAIFVLEKTAMKGVARIRERGDGRCIGGFLSVRSWLLVLLMIGGGRLLRAGWVPMSLLGFIYVAVGVALVVGSRKPWLSWYRYEPFSSDLP